MNTARGRGSRPDDLVQSVSRALRVLEVVSATPGLPVKAIARRAELNVSTTYHLVRTLAYEGYLERLPNGCYEVGPELPRRFHELTISFDRPPAARQVLQHLTDTTGLTAALGRFSNGRLVVTDMTEGPGSPYIEDLEVGLDVAAHATALGKAFLASLTRRQRHEYLADQGMRPFTANTRTDLDTLENDLRAVRTSRPVVEHGEFRDWVSCSAGLIPRDDPAEPYWGIVISIRGHDLRPEVNTALMQAARDLATA